MTSRRRRSARCRRRATIGAWQGSPIVALARPGSSMRCGRPSAATVAPSPSVRPDDLAALVIRCLVDRTRIDPALIEDVILGCANQAGEDNRNVARMAALLAGLPVEVGGPDREPAVRLRAPGDQLGGPGDQGRRGRRVRGRRRRVDDPGAVRDAQAAAGYERGEHQLSTRRSAGGSSTRSSPRCTTRTRWARRPRTSPSGGASIASARMRSR